MTTAEWTADVLNILLIVLIVCVSVAGIIAVKGFIEEGMLRKRSIRFALVFGFLFMVYLVVHVLADLNLLADCDALSGLREILPSGWAQIFLVLGLVGATGFYALMAFRQAGEMRDARHDALRPIIDIVNIEQMPIELARQAYAEEPPKELPCKLCNVGVGPATDVYSFVCPPSSERRRHNFDTIAIGKEKGPKRLSLAQKDDHWFLVAYYKDVYGRWFESSREVRVGAVNPDPLQIHEITEEELPK